MIFTPIGDRVLVRVKTQETVTASGLFIPETAEKEKPQQGTLVAVGPGRTTESGKLIPMQTKEGDEVLFPAWAGNPVKINGQEFLVMREPDLMGVGDRRPQGET